MKVIGLYKLGLQRPYRALGIDPMQMRSAGMSLVRFLMGTAVVGAVLLGFDRQAPADTKQPLTATLSFEKYKLNNGLEVILHEDHRTPTVAVNIWYHVGSKDEPAGRNGFAHLFEHVMFQGSKHVAEDTFFKYLEQAGVSDRNGTTNLDRTNYYETLPANQLELALWLESDRMGFLLERTDPDGKKTSDEILDETFKKQRDVVLNERRQNYEDAPYGQVSQFIHSTLYPAGHPYHLLTIGSPEDLNKATVDDVKAFFKTYYVPNNATLVIAGDIDKTKTKELVEKYFGPLLRRPDPTVKTKAMPSTLTGEKHLNVEAGVELPMARITWPSPAFFAPGDGELDLVSRLLSDGKTSRLYKRLVYDMQIAQNVAAYQSSEQLASDFEIVVTLKKDKSPSEALKVIDEELDKLRTNAPPQDEVDRGKTGLLTNLIFSLEKVTARANMLNQYNQYTGDPGYLEKDLKRYADIQPADVTKAVNTYLPKDRRIITIVTPNPAAPKAGRLTGDAQ